MNQRIITADGEYKELDHWFRNVKCCMLVCGNSIKSQKINRYFEEIPTRLNVRIVRFMDFAPNPLYESVVKGRDLFRDEYCDAIIAVGGGSAMDVAKCIRINSGSKIPFLAVPTTAGTGSEATRYAVIYKDGKKQSITSDDCIPDTVLMDAGMLRTLPLYHRKASMLDAFSHAIESFWSVNSTEESRRYSKGALEAIIANMDGYLANTDEGNMGMLIAANVAGKAISITQTTAGHAMCYKITSLFGCAHGHAAFLCNRILFPWMIKNIDKCIDPRGREYLEMIFDEIGNAMGCSNAKEAGIKILEIFDGLGLEVPVASEAQYEELRLSVNEERLRNNPIALDGTSINELYHSILN